MPPGLDIVTNDAGENVRRAHARDLGEDVIVALHRLVRLTKLHDVENQAFARQLEQTHKLIVEYCLHAGTNLSVLFAYKVVLIGGQILKGSRAAYEAAIDLGENLAWCGGSEMVISRSITARELKEFAESLGEALRSRRAESFRCPTDKVRLRQVSEAAKLRGVDVEHLDLEQRVVRTYASAVVVMRRFFADLQAGRYIMPAKIKRIAQGLVDLSEGQTPAFLGVTEVRNQNHDDAGRAVNTAILAVATARHLSQDRSLLSQIAMAAIMHDVARPRALRALTGGQGGPIVARLGDDAEDRQASGAAAVLTALGRVNEPTIARTVITYEALWLRRLATLGPVYHGLREPTLHARIVAIARRYNDLVTPEPGLPPPPPDRAIARLCVEFNTPADLTVLRLLVAALGVFPAGTLVSLSTGETAEVVPGRSPGAPYHLPRVRLIMDARGGIIAPAVEVDLAAPPRNLQGAVIARVLNTDGWARALQNDAEAPQRAPDDSADSLPPPAPASATPSVAPVGNEDSIPSAVSNSLTRSLGWHDAAQARPPSQPSEPRPTIPTRPRTAPVGAGDPLRASVVPPASAPPPSARPPVRDPLAATVPGMRGPLARASESQQRNTIPAAPRARLHDSDHDEVSDRTVLAPSPFEVEHDDVDDEAGTVFLRRDSSAPKPANAPKLEIDPNLVPTAQGDLQRTPLVHVLVYVLDRELSGSLVVRDPEHREHCVVFSQGAPSKVRTDHPVALLGEELIGARLLPPAALDATIAAAQQHHALLGDYLVRNRLLTRHFLEQALRAQIVHRLEWLAKLPGESTYAFYRERDLLETWGGEATPCDPLNAILAAMRSWNDHNRIISNLMRLKENPIRLHPEASLDGLTLTPEESALIENIRQNRRTLLELYGNSLAQDRGISAFLYMLFATRQLVIPGQQRGPMRSSLPSQPAPVSAPPATPQRSSYLETPQHAPAAPPSPAYPYQNEDNSDEGSYDSYPSLPTSPSAVAQAVIADMQASISFRGQVDPLLVQAVRDDRSFSPTAPLPTQGLEPAARGKLGTTPLIHVLTYMLDHGATGSVTIREPEGIEHGIYFERGCPGKVKTGRPIAMLGEMLVARGQLDRSLVDGAVDTAREIDALIGEYLIVESLTSRAAVTHALEAQVVEKVVGLVNLPDESIYSFYRGHNLLVGWAAEELFLADPLHVIHAAARQWADRRRMRGALHKIRDHELNLHPEASIDGLQPTAAEREVLRYIHEGGHTLRTLHNAQIASEEEVNSIVYAMAITRQFQFRTQGKPPMRVPAAPSTRESRPGPARSSSPPGETADKIGSEPPSWNSMRISVLPVSLPPGVPSPTGLPRASKTTEPPSDRSPVSGLVAQRVDHPEGVSATAPQTTPPSSVRRAPVAASSARTSAAASRGGNGGAIAPQDASEVYQQALDSLRKGNRAKAEELARSAAQLDPTCGDYTALAAWAAASSSKPGAVNEAIALLSEVLNTDPACESARFYRAKLYRRAGQVGPALLDLESILKQNPGHKEAAAEARLLRARQRTTP